MQNKGGGEGCEEEVRVKNEKEERRKNGKKPSVCAVHREGGCAGVAGRRRRLLGA